MVLSFSTISLLSLFTVFFSSDFLCLLNFVLSAVLSWNSFGSDYSKLNPSDTYFSSSNSFGSYFSNFGISSGSNSAS